MLCVKYMEGRPFNRCGASHKNLIHDAKRIADGYPGAHRFEEPCEDEFSPLCDCPGEKNEIGLDCHTSACSYYRWMLAQIGRVPA